MKSNLHNFYYRIFGFVFSILFTVKILNGLVFSRGCKEGVFEIRYDAVVAIIIIFSNPEKER